MTEFEPNGGDVVTAPMPLARFQTLIATYGASPERWPEAARAAARSLLDRGPEARDALADAALLDRALATAEPPAPSEDLVRELHRCFNARRASAGWLRLGWRLPSMASLGRPGLALAGVVVALLVVVLVRDQVSPESNRAMPGSTVVRAVPSVEFSDDGFVEDTDSLDLEIALIDRSLLDPTGEGPFGEPASLMGLTVASAPSLEDLPLD